MYKYIKINKHASIFILLKTWFALQIKIGIDRLTYDWYICKKKLSVINQIFNNINI